jgi:SAM-dependent methyltransferase
MSVDSIQMLSPGCDSVCNTESGYDAVVDEYVRRLFDELKGKPFDCELLDRFAAQTRDAGLVADIGCGPGHVSKYLNERGVQICGIDLSSKMVKCASRLNPSIEFHQGNMKALDMPDSTLVGIVAFYSIIHIPRDQILETMHGFRRALRPGGVLLLSFHIGDEVLHLDELWGSKVSLDYYFFQSDEMVAYIEAAGLKVDELIEREPYAPEVEYQSRRSYIFARNPSEIENSPTP